MTPAQKQAHERDGEFCLCCKMMFGRLRPAVHIHHIAHRKGIQTDQPDLCIVLCLTCHTGYHDRAYPTKDIFVEAMFRAYGYRLWRKYPGLISQPGSIKE